MSALPETSTSYSIAEAAALSGLTTHTLRYYERDGLMLVPVGRASTGHRRYGPEDLRWIEMVTRLRSTGMPVREVRRYADLVRAGDGNEAERLELLRTHRRAVLRQLAETTEHLGAIDRKIGIYVDRLEQDA
ncbi:MULTISPECIES: MerR family transcriptional regulator [unclassified Nocardioides]|uniref:MerR family transcriptional regulator n=1 Tax=unclassified Nocardioides TaxID=2615069 RepID=UPI002404B073|nr:MULTISPECIES: MerR family transcriptional regulator [unclassified Nocardioides]